MVDTMSTSISVFARAIFSSSPSVLDHERVEDITNDPNRIIFGRYDRNRDETIDVDGIETPSKRWRQFPTGERCVREFDPRSWQFGQTYVVPEQTSARYLYLGETRKSLMCRLLVNYHDDGEHRLASKEVLRAIDSPSLRNNPEANTRLSPLLRTVLEDTVELPFKLLTVVRATEMLQPEFTTAVIKTLLNSVRVIRREYVRYDEVIDANFNWRNMTTSSSLRMRMHVILACAIDTPEYWADAVAHTDTAVNNVNDYPIYTDAVNTSVFQSGRVECVEIIKDGLPFAVNRYLHIWLSLDIQQFYNRVLPVLLYAIPHFSLYDRSCATECMNATCNPSDKKGEEVFARCYFVTLEKYREVLTKSVLFVITHRVVFDLRYKSSQLVECVGIAKMCDLF